MKKAEDNIKASKDFKKEINDKSVNQNSIDIFKDKMDAAGKTLEHLN
ncbi:hypothetical protein [Bacillus sp. EB600]|nr:hypothetical protein [Bacillus sp. EB600]MCQ6282873.1 hypothetical protein [Bacillus sp. EB600]